MEHIINFNVFINPKEVEFEVETDSEEQLKVNDEEVKGGLADETADEEFDPQQLSKGIKVEMEEHTDNPKMGKEIAKDHLTEDPKYYTHLKSMEDIVKKMTQ